MGGLPVSRWLWAALPAGVGGLFGTPAFANALANPFAGPCESKPIFAEDFSGPSTVAHWTIITRPAQANANRELQGYSPQAIATGPGGLRITAVKHPAGYGSGRIASKEGFRYGCFDIAARMPSGKGLWPALWLRTPYATPIDGEIDIMEGFGSHPGLFQSTLHRWTHGVHHGFACARIGDARASAFGLAGSCRWLPRPWRGDFVTGVHHYGLIWTPQALTWLVDGTPYYTLRGAIPDQNMHIQVNLAVGGIFDGAPAASTPFPAALEVHALRVWRLRP
jgi:beta-glucanase (GH16 family)